MIPKRQDILNRLGARMSELRRQGVKTLALFGSAGRDQAGATSDVDLLVEFDRPVGLFQLFSLQHHLEQVLGVDRVDLVTPTALKPALRQRVLAEAVQVWKTIQDDLPPLVEQLRGVVSAEPGPA